MWRGEFGEKSGESFGGEGFALAVEIVDAHVAEVLDVCAELVGCGGHELIVKAGNRASYVPPIARDSSVN